MKEKKENGCNKGEIQVDTLKEKKMTYQRKEKDKKSIMN